MRRILGLLFLLWIGGILVVYYVVQKPGLLNASAGLADTFWTILVAAILLFNAYGIGKRILNRIKFEGQDSIESLLFSFGIGLGVLGLLGLLFSVIQLANKTLLTTIQFGLLVLLLLRNDLTGLRVQVRALMSKLNLSWSQYSFFTKLALILPLIFSFLLTLVPPFEAFDALLYHLALPTNILQNGGLRAVDNAPFWFPSLSENVYLWALGMGSEGAAQIMHFGWMLLSALLLWHWASKTWGIETARKSLLLVAAIPSLPMLASWAYTDMALVFYGVASIYALTQYCIRKTTSWLTIAGMTAGLAMGVKYTSFVVPLACGIVLLFHRPFSKAISSAAQFSLVTLAIACPWYVRNLIFMGNPFYPFVFGGRYWDSFLASWYADSGTGIGWNAIQIISLPLTTTLGTRDVTFFDGRIGPLFLSLAPFTLWILWTRAGRESVAGWSLFTIGFFFFLSFAAWTIGVFYSSSLWQARLLFPALIPFTVPAALAWDSLNRFDSSKVRMSFVANSLIVLVIVLTMVDNGIFVVQRNPLAVALGAQSRDQYIQRINPSYAALMKLVDNLPANAQLYSLFEPRSYGLSRHIQPDPINANFAHDVYLYQTPDAILQQWKAKQYTHVIVYERGLDFLKGSTKFTPEMQRTLEETLVQLILISQTPDHIYSLYKIQ